MNDGLPSTIGLTENFEPFNRKEKSMPYTLIKGEFYIHYPWNPKQGPEPDGDTLKFKPINRRILESLPRAGSPVKITGSRGNDSGRRCVLKKCTVKMNPTASSASSL